MSLVFNSKTYNRFRGLMNSILYAGPNNTVTTKDTVKLAATEPKPVTTSSGVARVDQVFTRTVPLTGAIETFRDFVAKTAYTVPVGMASADVDAFCADYAAWIVTTAHKDLLKKLTIDV